MTNIKVFNFPQSVSSEQARENEIFIDKLEKLLKSYEFVENGGVERLCIGLIYNKKLALSNPLIYNEKLYLATSNTPNLSNKQDLKNSVFRANLDLILKNYKFYAEGGIEQLIVILFYNKNPYELKIKGLDDERNEEGLSYFSPIVPKYRIDQVILNEDLLAEIEKTLIVVNKKNVIYDEWGFGQVDPEPRAIINFYGLSGTGKTMTAHAIANELGCKILVLNYADIESKFVGDAPKNLVRSFETASKEKALLFFDEADSFLGKRITNVSTGADQAINSLRSQMLILLENFEGIVIFATNLLKNYDRAFESRIFKHLSFDLPSFENRKKIINKTIPSKVPFEKDETIKDTEIDALAKVSEGFSGREIKNAVLEALINAVSQNRESVTFSDFEMAFKQLKISKQKLQNEYEKDSSLDLDKKKRLEEKITAHLSSSKQVNSITNQNTNHEDNSSTSQETQLAAPEPEFFRSLVDIACYAAFADGTIQPQEKDILEKTAKAFNLNYKVPESSSELPPLKQVTSAFNDRNKCLQAIDFVVHIISADGTYSLEEEKFIKKVCQELGLQDDDSILKVNSSVVTLAEHEQRWLSIKNSLNFSSST